MRVDWGGCELSGVGSGGSERDEQRKKKKMDDSMIRDLGQRARGFDSTPL